ncbi:MAG: hypothetical protein C0609_01085 [Deltaproteobacteria bacterium]|nr:MAG: hypothetical protein C0609_01085 [Deltaproteobacteria bacterium]
MKIKVITILIIALLAASLSFALDSSKIRSIKRARTMQDLAKEADDIAKDMSGINPADAEEALLVATEMQAYLAYIIARQNELMADKLDALAPSE